MRPHRYAALVGAGALAVAGDPVPGPGLSAGTRCAVAKGGKVIAQSKPVPIKHVIAATTLSLEQRAALRKYFIELDGTEDGRRKLEPTKLKGFMAWDQAQMLELGRWLGL